MNGKITKKDVLQASIGAFSSTIFFFLLKEGPLRLDWKIGFFLSLAWILVVYIGFNGHRSPSLRNHFIMCIVVSTLISGALSIMFGLETIADLMSVNIFGSTAMVGVLVGLPVALLFDLKNLENVLSSYNSFFVHGRRR